MALTATEVLVAPNGHVFIGSAAGIVARPASLTVASASTATGFTELGYITDDGVSITPNVDSDDIMAWQTLSPVKTILTASGLELKFTLLQTNEKAIETFFNFSDLSSNGTVASLDVAASPSSQERSLLVTWADDAGKNYELYFARAFCTDRDDLTLSHSDALQYGVTFKALADNSSPAKLAQFRSDATALLIAS